MRIQHNITALNAYRNYNNNTSALSKNLEKLSSGYKINRAGDDAAGLAISEKMRAQITGLNAAQKNVKDGVSLVKTAEGAMQEIHDMLNRMDYLATQSANGTYDNEVDRANLQKEVDALKTEIDRIADSANFNGIKLLDGSLDENADLTKFSDGLKIADWVGSTQNSLANVGDGTIVHAGQQEAKATTFSVELNNSTVTSDKGVSIQLGDNEALTLDANKIAKGATAEEIATAMANKYKDGVELLAQDGTTKVEFAVEAKGDKIVFTQKEMPTDASQIVDSKLAIKYEGIGSTSESNSSAALNTAAIQITKPTTSKSGAAETGKDPKFTWSDTATAEQRNALNNAIENNTTATQSVSFDVTGTADGNKKMTKYSVDVTSLKKALGDDYTITAKAETATDTFKEVKADEADPNIFNVTNSATAQKLHLTISDKDGNEIGSLVLQLQDNATAAANATASTDNKDTFTIKQGVTLNTNAVSTHEDGGNLLKVTTDKSADPAFNMANLAVAAANTTTTTKEKLQSALNEVLGDKGAAISFQMSDLTGNTAGTGAKLNITLDEALADAGYYLEYTDQGGTATKVKPGKAIEIGTGAGKITADSKPKFTLKDKDGNTLGEIELDLSDANTKKSSGVTTVTLNRSGFTKDAEKTSVTLAEKATISIKNKEGQDVTVENWGSTTAADGDDVVKDGAVLTMTIDGKDYSVTLKDGGLTDEEKKSGKYIDISDTTLYDGTNSYGVASNAPSDVIASFKAAVQQQMTNAAKEAATGTEDYTEYKSLAFTALTGDDAKYIKVVANTTNYAYSIAGNGTEEEGTTPVGVTVAGGKDPNASTTHNTTGQIGDAGRLASTYITTDMLKGLKDGSQLKVGDTTYTFAVGKDSKVSGDNVIDLKDMTAGDKDLLNKALERLSHADNEMFSIGYDDKEGSRVTFTENKEYTWGEGVDLSTRDGIAEQFAFSVDGAAHGSSLTLQIGDTSDSFNQMKVSVGDMHTAGMGIDGIDISTQQGATAAVQTIKDAINYVSGVRGDLGAIQNRLEHTGNNLSVMAENIQDAESTIRDTDVADEMMNYVKNNILVQSAQAMLAQANQLPQGVLQLLG